jgi:hypothetical protein
MGGIRVEGETNDAISSSLGIGSDEDQQKITSAGG